MRLMEEYARLVKLIKRRFFCDYPIRFIASILPIARQSLWAAAQKMRWLAGNRSAVPLQYVIAPIAF